MGRKTALVALLGVMAVLLAESAQADIAPKPKPLLVPSCLWKVFTAYPTPQNHIKFCLRHSDRCDQGAALFGATDNLELRVTQIEPERGRSATTLSLKYQVQSPTLTQPAISLGVEDITEDTRVGRAFYVIASHSLPAEGIRAHAGAWTDDRKTGLLLGCEAQILPKTLLTADYDRDSVNAGVRVMFPQYPALLEIGFFDVDDDPEFVVGVRHLRRL